jgi:hypothetical protein
MRKEISIRGRWALFRMEKALAEGAPEKMIASVHRRFRDRQELPTEKTHCKAVYCAWIGNLW